MYILWVCSVAAFIRNITQILEKPCYSTSLNVYLHLVVKCKHIWVFPKIGVPQNGWFIMEIPIKMDDLGVPPFSETPILIYTLLL